MNCFLILIVFLNLNIVLLCPVGTIQGIDQNLCYKFIGAPKDFWSANSICVQQNNGVLASVSSAFVNNFLSGNLQKFKLLHCMFRYFKKLFIGSINSLLARWNQKQYEQLLALGGWKSVYIYQLWKRFEDQSSILFVIPKVFTEKFRQVVKNFLNTQKAVYYRCRYGFLGMSEVQQKKKFFKKLYSKFL